MRILVVVDMQNDFVDGALGTKEAVGIVPAVAERIRSFDGLILYTRDTHESDYMKTQEGKKLPVPHCIRGTEGWELCPQIKVLCNEVPIDKPAFGSVELGRMLKDYGKGGIRHFCRFMYRHMCHLKCNDSQSISSGDGDYR